MKAAKRAAGPAAAGKKTHLADRTVRPAVCPEEMAFLEMARTVDLLSRRFLPILKAEHLSSNQYNVLRILRGAAGRGVLERGAGAESAGLACGEIGDRMITRDPDITRLLDRLEQHGLIERWRDERDRRVVMARITPGGLKLLSRMDEPVREAHRRELGHLGAKRLRELVELLKLARQPSAAR